MAKPGLSYTDMVAAAHSAPVGSNVQGFTLESRTEHDGGNWYTVVVTKASNTWTCTYVWHGTGGKIVAVYDEDGRLWFPQPWVDDWGDGGIS